MRFQLDDFVTEQIHQGHLIQDVTPTNVAAMRILTAAQAAMLERGLSEVAAYTNGLNMLMKQVTQLAKVQSFDDCFFIATVIALLGIIPAAFLKRDHKPEPPHPVQEKISPPGPLAGAERGSVPAPQTMTPAPAVSRSG